MNIQEINKYFGTPISELAKPKTLSEIKFAAGLNGFILGAIFGAVIVGVNYANGKFDDINRERLLRQKRNARPIAS